MTTLMRILESVACDLRFLRLPELAVSSRVKLVLLKYAFAALACAHVRTPRSFRLGDRRVFCDSFYDPWFLVFYFVDARDALKALGLLGKSDLNLVDIGAHNGETALVWSHLLDAPTIYSFEPNPDCYENLRRTTSGLRVRTFNVGLGDRDGREPFDMRPPMTIHRTFAFGDHAINEHSILVDMCRGDELIDLPHIDLLKIDVEGFERQVLDGLSRTLPRCDLLQVEVSFERKKAHRFDEFARSIGRHPFELVRAGHMWREHGRPTSMDLFLANCREP